LSCASIQSVGEGVIERNRTLAISRPAIVAF
jgi:hypothetical protein